MKDKRDIYDEVTARIIAEMEAGRLPWVKPWDANHAACVGDMPVNASTGRAYSGINVILCWLTSLERGYAVNRYLTFKQCQAMGGNVRKGEKGSTVVFLSPFVPKKEQERANAAGTTPLQSFMLKRYTVFNVAQCDALPETCYAPASRVDIPDPNAAIEAIVTASGARVQHGGPTAFYSPGQDVVVMPPQESFVSPDGYYAVKLHELTHWTGHPSRLDRDQKGAFGSKSYAFEELIAEIGSAFTCAALGIQATTRHSDYVAGWLAVLKEDNRAIIRAASQASKAADYLLRHHQGAEAADVDEVETLAA